jgi:aspartate carbamoyltransferase catalytic subunit
MKDSINWGPTDEILKFHKSKFEEFASQSEKEIENACKNDDGKLVHILRAEHFDLGFLERICETANAARRIAKPQSTFLKNLLRGKTAWNYFEQPSSRTYESFFNAEGRLGMQRGNLKDLATSSHAKGETHRDALRTFSSFYDVMVCRTPSDIFDLYALWAMKTSDREIPVINAGSGKKEHPTQAILDYYTIRESFDRKMDNKVGVYVGDCLRGRTVHSLAKVMALHKGGSAFFVGPQHLQIDQETERYLLNREVVVHKIHNKPLEDIVPLADFIYMTRVQNEHGGDGKYDPKFIFKLEHLDRMRQGAILMHPLPKREEIDPRIDYLSKESNDSLERERVQKNMMWRQVRNGMWTRLALLSHIFDVDNEIRNQYKQLEKATAPKPL